MTQKSGVPLVAQPVTVTVFGFSAFGAVAISALAMLAKPTAAPSATASESPIRIDIGNSPHVVRAASRAPALGRKWNWKSILTCENGKFPVPPDGNILRATECLRHPLVLARRLHVGGIAGLVVERPGQNGEQFLEWCKVVAVNRCLDQRLDAVIARNES